MTKNTSDTAQVRGNIGRLDDEETMPSRIYVSDATRQSCVIVNNTIYDTPATRVLVKDDSGSTGKRQA